MTMINEKKIEEAKKAFIADKKILGVISIMDLSCGFREGANWAINEFLKDLWHPASEEPDVRNKTIICLYDDGSICQDYEVYVIATDHDTHNLQIGEFNWNCYAENEGIKKWCYKDDLLPKKGGKQ